MDGQIIKVGQQEYVMGHYLASGLLGTVFPAINKKNPSDKIAVKVPALGLKQDLKDRFWEEFEVYKAFKAKWDELYVEGQKPFPLPGMSKGQNLTTKQEVLAMEFIGNDVLTASLSKIAPPLEKERFLIEVATQYADLLAVLHQAGYICRDRKPDDLYWDENKKRLIVLDWNVVAPKDEAENNIGVDFYTFGSLWYQFLTGRYPSSDMGVLDDDAWSGISIAFRYSLSRLLSKRTGERYRDDSDLVETLTKVKELLSVTFPDTLSRYAQTHYEKSQKSRIEMKNKLEKGELSVPNIDWGDNDFWALICKDLACRQDISFDFTHPTREELFAHFQERESLLFMTIKNALQRGEYQKGLEQVDVLRQLAKQSNDPQLVVAVERWSLFLRAGSLAKQKDIYFRDVPPQLEKWLSFINEKKWGEAESVIKNLGSSNAGADLINDKDLVALFNILRAEAWAHSLLSQASEYEQNGEYGQALNNLGSIEEKYLTPFFFNIYPEYGNALVGAYPGFNIVARRKELKKKKPLADLLKSIRQLVSTVKPGEVNSENLMETLDYILYVQIPEVRSSLGHADMEIVGDLNQIVKMARAIVSCLLVNDPVELTYRILDILKIDSQTLKSIGWSDSVNSALFTKAMNMCNKGSGDAEKSAVIAALCVTKNKSNNPIVSEVAFEFAAYALETAENGFDNDDVFGQQAKRITDILSGCYEKELNTYEIN
jgi:serine/threonine protein kinase